MAIALKLRNLLYVIHAVPPERLRPHLPPGVELDLRDTAAGPRAFIATVTLESGAAFPYVLSGFRQVNYRVYVRHASEPGVLFMRSWVSARAAAAVLSLAIPTEHAQVQIDIEDEGQPYSRYQVRAQSGAHRWAAEAHADPGLELALPGPTEETLHFLMHRLNGFVASNHPKGDLSVIRVAHAVMHPITARARAVIADQWTEAGILTPEEAGQPLVALIQPEAQFDMNLPEKIA